MDNFSVKLSLFCFSDFSLFIFIFSHHLFNGKHWLFYLLVQRHYWLESPLLLHLQLLFQIHLLLFFVIHLHLLLLLFQLHFDDSFIFQVFVVSSALNGSFLILKIFRVADRCSGHFLSNVWFGLLLQYWLFLLEINQFGGAGPQGQLLLGAANSEKRVVVGYDQILDPLPVRLNHVK